MKGDSKFLSVLSEFLKSRGYDTDSDENFVDTPRRVYSWFSEFCKSKEECIKRAKQILSRRFPSVYSGIVLVQGVQVFSLCPHHLLPVKAKVAFAYVPGEWVVGISKIPRFLREIGKALWLQEDYTKVVLDVFEEEVKPQGVMVVVEGEHFCMKMRGVQEPNSVVQTMAISGVFQDGATKMEVLHRLNVRR